MADVVTRNTVGAVVVEVTEGVLVKPSSAAHYFRLQTDFTMSPNFENIETAEMSGSIAKSAPIIGAEDPTFSVSHYFRNSGVVGTAPDYAPFLKAVFGSQTTQAVERNTVAGSTVSVVNVDTGEGVEYQRGQALLVKDPVNGFSIRPVESVSTDALTLGFDLANAPGTGVDLGRATTWVPTDTGHQTLSIWNYVGNEGAIQACAGARIVSMSITCESGQLVNASYSMEGIESFYNPLITTASLRFIDFTDDDGTFAAAVAIGAYKTPHELALAIAAAMNATATTETHTCTYSNSTGKFTFAATGAVFSILWNTGTNAANTIGTLIGFSVAANDTAALTYTADDALDLSAPHTPTYNSASGIVAKNLEIFIGDNDDITCLGISSANIQFNTPKASKGDLCAASGRSGSVITSREGSVTVSMYMSKFEADKFQRYQKGTTTRFMLTVGTKTGGNWDAGKCMLTYLPLCKVSAFQATDLDGLMRIELTLTTFHDGGAANEMFISAA